MSHRIVPLKLVPPGLLVDHHEIGTDGIVVHAHGASATSACPVCGLGILLGAQPLWADAGRRPGAWPASQDPVGGPAVPVSERRVRAADLHGAAPPGSHPGSRSTHLAPRRAHPRDRPRPRRPSRRKARRTPLHAGGRRHAAAPPAPARNSDALHRSRRRHRRFRLAEGPALRDDHLRSRASPHDRSAAGPGGWHRRGLAFRPSRHRDRVPRPRQWLSRGGRKGAPQAI